MARQHTTSYLHDIGDGAVMKHLLTLNSTDREMVEVWGEMKLGFTMLCGVMHQDCFSDEIKDALQYDEVLIEMKMEKF